MKKIKIIILLIVITISVNLIWDFFQIRRLEIAAKEISPIAKTTIESLYYGDSKFIDTVSATDTVKNLLYKRMEVLQSAKYHTTEVMSTNIESINIYRVVILSYIESEYPNEYRLKFKKINKKWKVIDFIKK